MPVKLQHVSLGLATYFNLDQTRANLSIQVAALRAERSKLGQAVVQLNNELNGLRSRLADQQVRQTQLVRAVDNAKQVYDVLLQRREEAWVASTSQAGSVRLVAEAIVPSAPVGPRKIFNVILAAVLGLMAGTMLAFVLEYFGVPIPSPVSARTQTAVDPSRHSEA